jgi:hypothetical protein
MRRLVFALLVAGVAAEAQAQRVIHDAGRDATAQETVTAMKDVTSGGLFETMLRNADAQAKLEVDGMLAHVREEMRSAVIALDVWFIAGVDPVDPLAAVPDDVFARNAEHCPRSVECLLRDLRAKHRAALAGPAVTKADLDKKVLAIEARVAALRGELKALQDEIAKKSGSPADEVFTRLEAHGASVIAFAKSVVTEVGTDEGRFKGASNALDEVGKGLEQVIKIYRVTRDIWSSRELVSVHPASLRPPPQQTEIDLLLIEQEHLKTRARIEARRHLEVSAALRLVDDAIASLRKVPGEPVERSTARIEDTLRESGANRPRLEALLKSLHVVGAAVAQMEAADRLANIRLADEQRRFSIRRSAIEAGTYEVALRAAAQRLALYWKRGMKPADVAQFAAWIANTAALIEVARKD